MTAPGVAPVPADADDPGAIGPPVPPGAMGAPGALVGVGVAVAPTGLRVKPGGDWVGAGVAGGVGAGLGVAVGTGVGGNVGPTTVTVGPTRTGSVPWLASALNVTGHVPAGSPAAPAYVPSASVPETRASETIWPPTSAWTARAVAPAVPLVYRTLNEKKVTVVPDPGVTVPSVSAFGAHRRRGH